MANEKVPHIFVIMCLIDLMHNDVKQGFLGSNLQSRTNPIWRRIFLKGGNLNGSNLKCVLMWLGGKVAAQTICLSFQIGQIKLI